MRVGKINKKKDLEILSSKDKPHFGHCLYTISTGIYELGIVPWESA